MTDNARPMDPLMAAGWNAREDVARRAQETKATLDVPGVVRWVESVTLEPRVSLPEQMYDDLRAENERLVDLIAGAEQREQEAQSENERLAQGWRADIDAKAMASIEIDRLRAEIELLKARYADPTWVAVNERNAALRAENERLRAELQWFICEECLKPLGRN